MTTLNISLPESMREFIDQQIDQCGYSTASEYIRHLIRQDQEKAEKKKLKNSYSKAWIVVNQWN